MKRSSTMDVHVFRDLVDNLGADGGQITPAVYDTAMVAWFLPELPDSAATHAWLVAQQQPDGGWGSPQAPGGRSLPTLAALCVLARAAHADMQLRSVVAHACAFLVHIDAPRWTDVLPDDIPVGAELLLPPLLRYAAELDLDVPVDAYRGFATLGERRRARIAQHTPRAGTAPVHSWEGWGITPTPDLLDAAGSIGHSPAATAAWLAARRMHRDDAATTAAHSYLQAAQAAAGVPGAYPTVWPIHRFEQVWGLYALGTAGLLTDPRIACAIEPQLTALADALQPTGIGMSDAFMVDGDITATTLATLQLAGRQVDLAPLLRFRDGDHFYTYPGEMQPSVTTTAHAIHALALAGMPTASYVQLIEQQQHVDGRWYGDKWHNSWLYTTSQVIIALAAANEEPALCRGVATLLDAQHRNGGWGMDAATAAETAYAILALRHAPEPYAQAAANTITRAQQWLLDQMTLGKTQYWIGKDTYCPVRVDACFVQSALHCTVAQPLLAREVGR